MTKQWWEDHSDYVKGFISRRLTDLGIEVPTTWPPSPMVFVKIPTGTPESWYHNTEDGHYYKHRKYSMTWTRVHSIEEVK